MKGLMVGYTVLKENVYIYIMYKIHITYAYTCMVNIYKCIYTFIHIYVYVHVNTYVHVETYVYMYMYVYIHINTM
jgi:hypothetical protein